MCLLGRSCVGANGGCALPSYDHQLVVNRHVESANHLGKHIKQHRTGHLKGALRVVRRSCAAFVENIIAEPDNTRDLTGNRR